MSERKELHGGGEVIIDRFAGTIEMVDLGFVVDVCFTQSGENMEATAEVDGVFVCLAICYDNDGMWVGDFTGPDAYLVLANGVKRFMEDE